MIAATLVFVLGTAASLVAEVPAVIVAVAQPSLGDTPPVVALELVVITRTVPLVAQVATVVVAVADPARGYASPVVTFELTGATV